VRALLGHLQEAGFAGTPRYLGVDERGRETFSYLPGAVSTSLVYYRDIQLQAAAQLLCAFHDATAGTPLAAEHETVTHGDAGPSSFVFNEEELPYALIDFDGAVPGPRLADVAHMGWYWCVHSWLAATVPPSEQARQLRVVAESYGLALAGRQRLLDAVLVAQLRNAHRCARRLRELRLSAAARDHAERSRAWSTHEHSWLTANRAAFMSELG
jgi:aminoglycoside phosphotransferase (APT) family kinase protein